MTIKCFLCKQDNPIFRFYCLEKIGEDYQERFICKDCHLAIKEGKECCI